MVIYKLYYNGRLEEFYSLKDLRDRFRRDHHFFEFLECEGYILCTKINEKSRTEYFVKPKAKGEIDLEYRYNEKSVNGAYGN